MSKPNKLLLVCFFHCSSCCCYSSFFLIMLSFVWVWFSLLSCAVSYASYCTINKPLHPPPKKNPMKKHPKKEETVMRAHVKTHDKVHQ